MSETKERIYEYGTCHKCGARLTPRDLINGRVMCQKCRREEWENRGWT